MALPFNLTRLAWMVPCTPMINSSATMLPSTCAASSIRTLAPRHRVGVDQHEPNQGLRRGSIAPGVVRPALNQHVALPQQHLGCIENGPDLALQHEGVVYGGGAMHARVTCGAGMIDGLAARF